MAAKSIHSSRLAYYAEATQGLAPADWDDGQLIDHTGVDVSGVKQSLIVDPTLELDVTSQAGGRTMIKGLRSCELKASLKLHGSGVVTAGGSQIAVTPLMTIAKHCWGGIHRSNSTTLTGGSAIAPEVTAATNIVAGSLIGVEDVTSPSAKNTGLVHVRRVLDVTDLVVTLDRPLPFTPANTDKVHAMATVYFDEDVLIDSRDPAVSTFSWLVQKARTGADDLIWEVVGSVASLAFTGLTRNGVPGIDLSIMGANFRHGGITPPTWTGDSYGHAQLALGRNTEFALAEYGDDSAIGVMQTSSLAVEPGIPRVRLETIGEVDDLMEGTWGYSTEPAPTTATITIGAHSGAYETELQADTEYNLSYTQCSAAGKVWSIYMPRVQIAENPGDGTINAVHGASIKFQARVPDDAGTSALATSRIVLGLG